MKFIFHEDFYRVYTFDPAAAAGRLEAVVDAVAPEADFIEAVPAAPDQIAAVHTDDHIQSVTDEGLYPIAALAAGAAIQAATIGLSEPCFGLLRPPGHHASAGSAWGFCFFNNMAVAITDRMRRGALRTALVLDVDLHFGDGTRNILGDSDAVRVVNPEAYNRSLYLTDVRDALEAFPADIIGVSAGFDNHRDDWGGLMETEDYEEIGQMVRRAADRNGGGCFAILEGGYNHSVLGLNVLALMRGMTSG